MLCAFRRAGNTWLPVYKLQSGLSQHTDSPQTTCGSLLFNDSGWPGGICEKQIGGFIPQQLLLSPVWVSLVIPLVKTGRLDTRAIPYGDREAIT